MMPTRGTHVLAQLVAAASSRGPMLARRLLAKAPLQGLALQWGRAANGGSHRAGTEERPRFLVRVDDFPAHDQDTVVFLEFHSILARRGIPYLLGVTPFLASDPLDAGGTSERPLNEEDAAALRRACREGVDLALHGFTHRMRPGARSELRGMTEPQLRSLLERSLDTFVRWGLPSPIAFIPPFNAVDRSAARVLSDYVPLLCGGPETIHTLGFRGCPEHLEGMEFWPSFFPAYGTARNLSRYVRKVARGRGRYLIPITLHWRWEAKDAFRGVKELAASVAGSVDRWSECLTSLQPRKEVAHGLAGHP